MKILKESLILSSAFNKKNCIPTEQTFREVAVKLKDYTENGSASQYNSKPDLFAKYITRRYNLEVVLRYFFAAVLLNFDALTAELTKILKERSNVTREALQELARYVLMDQNTWNQWVQKYSKLDNIDLDSALIHNKAGQDGNYTIPDDLHLVVNAKPGEPFYKLVTYNASYAPPVRQFLIIRKKVGDQYTISIDGSPRQSPPNTDPVFDSIQQAINFAASAIKNIQTKRNISAFTFSVRSGLDKNYPTDLSDYELVDTTCGPAYMDKTCKYRVPPTTELDEAVEKHEELNPKLWTKENTLKDEVKEKINLIIDEFLDNLKENEVSIDLKDVVIVGSNCSYNYNKDSDLDIHLIAGNIDAPEDLYNKVYSAYRSIFNKNLDIEFYGIPVEIYVETENTPGIYNGVYSITQDKWLEEPIAEDIPEIDQEALDKEFKVWEDRYNKIIDSSKETLKESLNEDLDDDTISKVISVFENELTNWSYEDFVGASAADKEDIAKEAILKFPDIPEQEIYNLFWDWIDGVDESYFIEELQKDINTAKSIIADQIRGEWEAISNYDKAVSELEKLDGSFQNAIDVLNDIADEEEIHVGEEQKVLSELDNNVLDNINDGESEAEENLAGKESPVDESLNEKIEKQPDVKYKGFDIIHFPLTWKFVDGREEDVDGWIIQAPAKPEYCVAGDCQFRLPMRCHDAQYGSAINFKSLNQCKDWIDKFGNNYEIKVYDREIHAYPKEEEIKENIEMKIVKKITEDLIRDSRVIQDPMRYLFRSIGVDTSGYINSFVEIRDDYNDNDLYQALTSMFMRICINLKHRSDIVDLGWKYSDDERIAWNFKYNGKYFVLTSTHNSFDIYKSLDGTNYYRVIHANHSHCANTNDVRVVLEDDELGYGDGHVAAPRVDVSKVREVVKDAVSSEVRRTVTDAVRAEVEKSIRSNVGSSVRGAVAGSIIPGIVSSVSDNTGDIHVDDEFINRIVDAVIKALQANNII